MRKSFLAVLPVFVMALMLSACTGGITAKKYSAEKANEDYVPTVTTQTQVRELYGDPTKITPTKQVELVPLFEVTSTADAFRVRMELPGVSPEAVNIKVTDNVLTVSGEKRKSSASSEKEVVLVQERSFGTFVCSLNLPEDADAEGIKASAKDGVLQLEIPRKRPEQSRTRTIKVKRGY